MTRCRKWITSAAGVRMPWIIYGTAWKKERTADRVVQAVRAGFCGIDTACQPKHYSESLVGQALRRLADEGIARETLFLQTKFTPVSGQDPNRIPFDPKAPLDVQVSQSFDASRKNLQTDCLDSWVLHSPLATHRELMTVWRAMEAVQVSGGARQLGISNCYALDVLQALVAEARVKPAVIQNRFYRESGYDARLRRWCAAQNIRYQAFWTLTANPHVLASAEVQAMARKYGKTAPQVFFRYLNQAGIVPLTGTCSEQHMREDLDVFDFELESDEVDGLHRYFNRE